MTNRLSLMTFARMQAYGIVNLYSMCYNEAAINTNGIIAKYIFYKLEEMHMHKEINDKISVFKKAFLILLVLDIIGLISAVIALSPTFKQMAEYGQPMMAVFSMMFAIMVATQLFEILTKIFLIKSISPAFSWTSGRKGYIVSAKLLILFNFFPEKLSSSSTICFTSCFFYIKSSLHLCSNLIDQMYMDVFLHSII